MKLKTIFKLIFDKNIFSFLKLSGRINNLYRSSFAISAHSSGLLPLLVSEGKTFEVLCREMSIPASGKESFLAWLNCGVTFGELSFSHGYYCIKGSLSRHLSKPKSDTASAMFEEVARYHFDAVLHAPENIKHNVKYSLNSQDGDLIARSSRILEPFVEEAIDWALSKKQSLRSILEVGFGSGCYVKYINDTDPKIKITGIDFQEDVVLLANNNKEKFGMTGSVDFKYGDILTFNSKQKYDLITLHNNIYYFSRNARANLFSRVFGLCEEGGMILLTTSCKGGSPAIAALDLWFTSSDMDASLPRSSDLVTLAQEAGFENVELKQLMPGESYYALLAMRPVTNKPKHTKINKNDTVAELA